MKNAMIIDAIGELYRTMGALEEEYIENEGEVTESTEAKEAAIASLRELLENDGVDSLGRWLREVEDKKKSYKAEKDYIIRKMSALDKTADFIKKEIAMILQSLGKEKIKGENGYSFSLYTSTKTDVNKDEVKFIYQDRMEQAKKSAGIPDYITFTLSASAIKAQECGICDDDKNIFSVTTCDTCKFTKPRANKEEE